MGGVLTEITVVGIISKVLDHYVVTTDSGEEYELSAIMPWTAVSADYGTGGFVAHLGERVTVTGQTNGSTIYGAQVIRS